jgi:hypothetical protein
MVPPGGKQFRVRQDGSAFGGIPPAAGNFAFGAAFRVAAACWGAQMRASARVLLGVASPQQREGFRLAAAMSRQRRKCAKRKRVLLGVASTQQREGSAWRRRCRASGGNAPSAKEFSLA